MQSGHYSVLYNKQGYRNPEKKKCNCTKPIYSTGSVFVFPTTFSVKLSFITFYFSIQKFKKPL